MVIIMWERKHFQYFMNVMARSQLVGSFVPCISIMGYYFRLNFQCYIMREVTEVVRWHITTAHVFLATRLHNASCVNLWPPRKKHVKTRQKQKKNNNNVEFVDSLWQSVWGVVIFFVRIMILLLVAVPFFSALWPYRLCYEPASVKTRIDWSIDCFSALGITAPSFSSFLMSSVEPESMASPLHYNRELCCLKYGVWHCLCRQHGAMDNMDIV